MNKKTLLEVSVLGAAAVYFMTRNRAVPLTGVGEIISVAMWQEGMTGWQELPTSPSESVAPTTVIDSVPAYFAIWWVNRSTSMITGHLDLAAKGIPVPFYEGYQDREAGPDEGAGAIFGPITIPLDTVSFAATLSAAGGAADRKYFDLVGGEA